MNKKADLLNIEKVLATDASIGASKAFVIALTQSLQHELADKGVRIQAVLPGATATPFWDVAGMPVSHLPDDFVMTTDDLVDAALAGFDMREVYTIPALDDFAQFGGSDRGHDCCGGRYGPCLCQSNGPIGYLQVLHESALEGVQKGHQGLTIRG